MERKKKRGEIDRTLRLNYREGYRVDVYKCHELGYQCQGERENLKMYKIMAPPCKCEINTDQMDKRFPRLFCFLSCQGKVNSPTL